MQIKDLLARGRATFSFEFFPPRTEDAAKQLDQTIADLRELETQLYFGYIWSRWIYP